jgi:NTP pyrophosphatase (non-canonical NTP hydrolase)
MFYIYKTKNKIGCTNNLKNRVEKVQGVLNYDIIYKTGCIKLASDFELALQRKYNFKIDKYKYYKLINLKNKKMYHETNQTITFKGSNSQNLQSKLPSTLEINNELYFLDKSLINWIINNNFKSQYNDERFIYIQSFLNYYNTNFKKSIFEKIRDWAEIKELYKKGNPKTQCLKLQEEVGELAKGILKNNEAEIIDAIGDCVVVLTNLAHLCGFTIENCIESAYNEIKDRKGKMENGTFVKNE